MGYDGSINIDTKLDTKGFNKGAKSIGASLSGVMKSVLAVGKAMAAAFIGGSIINGIRSVIGGFDLMNSSIGKSLKTLSTSFASLKSSFTSLILTAFAPLIPYVIAAVDWLTKLFTTLAQVTAALFGTSVAVASIKDEASDAGKEAKKAAGALAGFDQINVLSKQEETGGGGVGAGVLPATVVPDGLLQKVQEFKDKMITFLQPVTDALGRLYDSLLPLGETIWSGLKWAWDNILVPLGEWFITDAVPAFLDLFGAAAGVLNEALIALQPVGIWLFENFLQPLAEWTGGKIIEFLDWLVVKLGELAVWIRENPEKFRDFIIIIGILAAVFETAKLIIAAFAITVSLTVLSIIALFAALAVAIYLLIAHWDELSTTVNQIIFLIGYYISVGVEFIKQKFVELWEGIKATWAGVVSWFTNNVSTPLKNAFETTLESISNRFTAVFEGIQSIVKGIINNIIGYINGMVESVLGGINAIVDSANVLGNLVPGFSPVTTVSAPQIPQLATGAVIPPNAQFAAILGDQKSGRNLEAPENLIRQIVREESGGGSQNINITFNGSMAELVRTLKPHIDNENSRVGTSLIKSGVTG